VNILFPFTIGVHNFEFRDILEGRIPDRARTLTFVPGVQFVVPVGTRWTLRPSAQFGAGWELEGDENAIIYSAGLDSLFDFSWKRTDFRFLSGLSYHGYTPNQGDSDDFLRLSLGLDVNLPLGVLVFERDLLVKPHTLFRWFIDDLERDLYEFSTLLEAGLSLGLEPKIKLLWFQIERIGLAYKISDQSRLRGIRFLLSVPF
jgi:hypothetical protein